MGYTLLMSTEIRDWLAELCDTDPLAALAVGQAVIALADAGPELGPPAVVALVPPLADDPRETLDYAYQDRLERLRLARHAAADAAVLEARILAQIAELEAARSAAEAGDLGRLLPGLRRAQQQLADASQRGQADLDAFRVRKEILKASYSAAFAFQALARPFAGADAGDEDLAPDQPTSAECAQRISTLTAEIERELRDEAGGLMELRPGVPAGLGGDVRVIFAVEPAGSALLISVLHGRDVVAVQHRQAVSVSARILRQVRAGEDREAVAVAFGSGRVFADALLAGRADEAMAGAAELVTRSRAGTLADRRVWLGLSQEQVAERMGVPPALVAAIERDEPSITRLGAIAGYVEALGGRLDVVADFGDARVPLR